MIFFILITFEHGIVLIVLGEIIRWSLLKIKINELGRHKFYTADIFSAVSAEAKLCCY